MPNWPMPLPGSEISGRHCRIGTPVLPPTQFGVADNDPAFTIGNIPMITSGLYQETIVNGEMSQSPLNAAGVLYGDPAATFTPIEQVQVFASTYRNSGIVISGVTGHALTVDLTQQPTQTIYYNDATNQFAPGVLHSPAR